MLRSRERRQRDQARLRRQQRRLDRKDRRLQAALARERKTRARLERIEGSRWWRLGQRLGRIRNGPRGRKP
jgi:hypothetical protein